MIHQNILTYAFTVFIHLPNVSLLGIPASERGLWVGNDLTFSQWLIFSNNLTLLDKKKKILSILSNYPTDGLEVKLFLNVEGRYMILNHDKNRNKWTVLTIVTMLQNN